MPEKIRQKHFEKISSNLEKMTRLIDHLLLFGKTFKPAYHNLFSICKGIIGEIQTEEGRYHNIELEARGDCDRVILDKEFMNIMVRNIIGNSIKYSPPGKKIKVTLSCDNEWAILKVSDNGIGIPADYMKMPFERFHRGSNVGAVPGTGLGLSIVKRYTDLHKGNISIESELNKGTTVTIKIPRSLCQNGGKDNE